MSEKITTPYESIMIDPNEPLILPDGTAITGRLEWFLYALCCLDYGNLPTPLSRIEVFANALITGELPDIEPQSRSEKFFFACLTGDTSDLPEPQSRSEVLLNKLATGQYDLSDIEPIQSRYELLLAYLIKNGGIGNVDYVLHRFAETIRTMYNTEEAPLKELLLSGNTEINVLQESVVEDYVPYGLDECYSGKITETTEVPAKHFTLYGDTKVNVLQDNINEDVVIPYTHEKAEEIVLTNTKSTGRVGTPIIEGQTVVNVVQEESNTEYTPMNKEYSGQTISVKKQSSMNTDNIYGRTFTNVLPEPSIRNEMANMSMQKLDEGIADDVVFKDGEYKSAILKGNTLVNLIGVCWFSGVSTSDGTDKSNVTATSNTNKAWASINFIIEKSSYKQNTDYIAMWDDIVGDDTPYKLVEAYDETSVALPKSQTGLQQQVATYGGKNFIVFNTGDCTTSLNIRIHLTNATVSETQYTLTVKNMKVIEYQDGMENWDIPYFEGIQSVKMPVSTTVGKNLFDFQNAQWLKGSRFNSTYGNSNNIVIENMSLKLSNPASCVGTIVDGLKPNTEYYISAKITNTSTMLINSGLSYVFNNTTINSGINRKQTTNSNGELAISIGVYGPNTNGGYVLVENIQIEESSVATPYEPYKSNILSISEEVELRGIDNVQDELDCLTGEMVERIGEIVLDGGSNVAYESDYEAFYVQVKTLAKLNDYSSSIISDKGRVLKNNKDVRSYASDELVLSGYEDTLNSYPNDNWIYLSKKDITSANDMKAWLAQNPITVQYQLATESIKTVDLITVNQDGTAIDKPIVYKDGHIQISGEEGSLLPSVSYEIPTTNSYYTDNIKANTIYTFKKNEKDFTPNFTLGGTSYTMTNSFTSTVSGENQLIINSDYVGESDKVALIEGNHIGLDIPYFEGTKYFDYEPDKIKGVTLEGQTLVNVIQEPSEEAKYVIGNGEILSGQSITVEQDVYSTPHYIDSATLEGQTLVNLFEETSRDTEVYTDYLFFKIVGNQVITLKPNTKYTLMFDKYIEGINTVVHKTHNDSLIIEGYQYGQKFTFTTVDNVGNAFHVFIKGDTMEIAQQMLDLQPKIVIIEGDYTNVDIPYFEGMQSVKMPVLKTVGKNLCDEVFELGTITDGVDINTPLDKNTRRSVNYYDIKGAQTLTLSGTSRVFGDTTAIIFYNLNKEYISTVELVGTGGTTSVPENAHFAKIRFGDTDTTLNVQLEESSVATQYEPFKSNILTANEEVELRGIGDVKDTLNLMTGELTQRIGEVVLDGSENWGLNHEGNSDLLTFSLFRFPSNIAEHIFNNSSQYLLSDSLPVMVDYENNRGILSHRLENNHWIVITVKRNELTSQDVAGFKQFLSSNPIKIQYRITESAKTVDLHIINQDNEETPRLQLQTPINHITTSSDALIPVVNIPSIINYDTIIKPSTRYTLRFNQDEVNADNPLTVNLGGTEQIISSNNFTMITPSTLTHNQLQFSGKGNVISKVQVIEGDVTNIEYPFFEGMSDVKFSDSQFVGRGKNLCQNIFIESNKGRINENNGSIYASSSLKDSVYVSEYIYIKGIEWLSFNRQQLNADGSYDTHSYAFYDCNKRFISGAYNITAIKVPNNAYYIRITIDSEQDFQLEEGSVATTYEPYKCVEVQQDVDSIPLKEIVLRGIGDVKDELDLTRGEYIQRIDEVVFDGSSDEDWHKEGDLPVFFIQWNKLKRHSNYSLTIKCDKLPVVNNPYLAEPTIISFSGYVNDVKYPDENWFYIVADMFSNASELKAYLQLNPITVQYVLTTPIFHKVNLTNSNKIQLYGTETHYETITPSDSLIPNITIPSTLNYDVAIKPSTKYTIRANTSDNLTVDLGGTTETLINGKVTLTTPTTLTHNEIKFSGTGKVKELMVVEDNEIKDNVMFFNGMKNIEIGSGQNILTVTSNETDKYQILLTNEEIALRSLPNGVCDTLNLVTGEYVQRVGEVVLNGENTQFIEALKEQKGDYLKFGMNLNPVAPYAHNVYLLNDRFNSETYSTSKEGQQEQIYIHAHSSTSTELRVCILPSRLSTPDEVGFNSYLQSNPITVQYELATPIIHKLNISNTDQDGNQQNSIIATNDYMTITTVNDGTNSIKYEISLENDKYNTLIKPSTKYTIVANKDVNGHDLEHITYNLGGATVTSNFNTRKVVITTPATLEHENLIITGSGAKVGKVMIVEGDIEDNFGYFEGMSSVKNPVLITTGKNLFDGNLEYGSFNWSTGLKIENSNIIRSVNPIKINSTNICLTSATSDIRDIQYVFQYDNSMNFISYVINVNGKISLDTNTKYIHIRTQTNDVNGYVLRELNDYQFQIEQGSQSTPYEPYKSNISTVTEDVELRGIGDVRDTLDCLTGEVTERIGEVVLDGSSNVVYESDYETFYVQVKTLIKLNDYSSSIILDKGRVLKNNVYVRNYASNDFVLSGYRDTLNEYPDNNWIYFSKKDITSASDMKAWLSQNPITVQYQLTTESIKTVDLHVINQDNNIIDSMYTFENITHVSTDADDVKPTVSSSNALEYLVVIKPNTQYTIFNSNNSSLLSYNLGGSYGNDSGEKVLITTPSALTSNTLRIERSGLKVSDLMVLEGNKEIIPYIEGMTNASIKQIITTTNDDTNKTTVLSFKNGLNLAKIGKNKDIFDVNNNILRKKIGRITLNGSENWEVSDDTTTNTVRYVVQEIIKDNPISTELYGVAHGANYESIYNIDIEGVILTNPNGHCYFRSTIRDLEQFKAWLQENPVTIQYVLANEINESVEYTIVDQDGSQVEKISSFDGSTNFKVVLDENSVNPSVEAEVKAQNRSTMNEISLAHEEINEMQGSIDDGINAQTNETDSTMMATTEIFENSL